MEPPSCMYDYFQNYFFKTQIRILIKIISKFCVTTCSVLSVVATISACYSYAFSVTRSWEWPLMTLSWQAWRRETDWKVESLMSSLITWLQHKNKYCNWQLEGYFKWPVTRVIHVYIMSNRRELILDYYYFIRLQISAIEWWVCNAETHSTHHTSSSDIDRHIYVTWRQYLEWDWNSHSYLLTLKTLKCI
jgi:hypothetical protein